VGTVLESFVITWRELLIVVVVVLAVYMAEMLLLLRANKTGVSRFGLRGGKPDKSAQRLLDLESELADVLLRLQQLEQAQDNMERPSVAPQVTPTPYSQAIQLAREGLDADAVAASCGISRGEAELIVAMHRARAS